MILKVRKYFKELTAWFISLTVEAMIKVNYRGERNRIVNSGFLNKTFFPLETQVNLYISKKKEMKPNIFKNCVRQQVNGIKQCDRKTTLTSIGAAIVSLCKKQQKNLTFLVCWQNRKFLYFFSDEVLIETFDDSF